MPRGRKGRRRRSPRARRGSRRAAPRSRCRAPGIRCATRPESRIESQALYNAISELPDDFRDALVAIDVVGLSYREASRALRVREATITTDRKSVEKAKQ